METSPKAQYKFTFTAGLLLRGTIVRDLERFCFENDLELDLRESKGWLESQYLVKISGTNDSITKTVPILTRYFNALQQAT